MTVNQKYLYTEDILAKQVHAKHANMLGNKTMNKPYRNYSLGREGKGLTTIIINYKCVKTTREFNLEDC